MAASKQNDQMRWVWRGSIAFIIVLGWIFIAWQNHFHLTPPTVFVCLGYFAVVTMVYNLWRTGAAAVAPNDEDDGDSTWGKPMGERGELEREKKAMLKAIKEAEFDQQMGKLSKVDADKMIKVYRARAIEVIKELDRVDAGKVGTVREQIEREVRARLELEGKSAKNAEGKVALAEKKAAAKAAKAAKKSGDAKADDAKADDAKDDKTEAKTDDAKAAKGDDAKTDAEKTEAKTDDAKAEKTEAKADDAKVEKTEAKADDDAAKSDDAKADEPIAASIAGSHESERKEAHQ